MEVLRIVPQANISKRVLSQAKHSQSAPVGDFGRHIDQPSDATAEIEAPTP